MGLHLAKFAVDELAPVFERLVGEVVVGRGIAGVLLHALVQVRRLIVGLNFLALEVLHLEEIDQVLVVILFVLVLLLLGKGLVRSLILHFIIHRRNGGPALDN